MTGRWNFIEGEWQLNLTPMRFKNFVWPHNPRTYTITYERSMANYKVPFGLYHLRSLGRTNRVLKGEGEFVGEGAYDTFKELATVFYEETPGVLVHPVWMTTTAWLVGLRLEQEPRKDYVRYSFEFWETNPYVQDVLTVSAESGTSAAEEDGRGEAAYHTVVKGDTLWELANTYEVSLSQLVGWNPQIKNPNLIRPGDKVKVSP